MLIDRQFWLHVVHSFVSERFRKHAKYTWRSHRRFRCLVSPTTQVLEQRLLLAAPEYNFLDGHLFIEFSTAEATSIVVDAVPPGPGQSTIVRVTYSGTNGTTVYHENLDPAFPAGVDPGLVTNITIVLDYQEDDPIENLMINLSGVDTVNSFVPGNFMTVNTGPGNDTVFGSPINRNVVHGHAGNDTILGGPLRDDLFGEAGNDSLIGGSGISDGDEFSGGSGDDTLRAATFDWTDAGQGELLTGNIMEGDSGNDSIIGDSGNDTTIGGNGNDTVDAKGGDDLVIGDGDVIGIGGADLLIAGDGNDTVVGGSSGDNIFGNDGNDRLIGSGGNDTLSGGAGNDIIAGDGDDALVGDKFDTYVPDPGGDSIDGGDGYDVIDAGPFPDTVHAGPGGEVTPGFFAGSLINGGSGLDEIYGWWSRISNATGVNRRGVEENIAGRFALGCLKDVPLGMESLRWRSRLVSMSVCA